MASRYGVGPHAALTSHFVSPLVLSFSPTNFRLMLLYFTDIFIDSTVLSHRIRNTTQSQPSLILEVKGGDYKGLRGTGRVHYHRRGYIIGYRECVSNPSEVCYIFHNDVSNYVPLFVDLNLLATNFVILDSILHYYTQLPEPFDDWTHDITVNASSSRPLPLGERCTFFGCFVYCDLESCKRVYRNFLEENVTIGQSMLNNVVACALA